MKNIVLFILVLLSTSNSIFSQDSTLSDSTKIYLLTCGPGDDLYNTFGHTGIRVFDRSQAIDIVFNYGIFDFDTEGFYTKFLRGKLLYNLGVQKFGSFLQTYKREKRTIYQQELNLTVTDRNKIYAKLIDNYKPENRAYKYDFFFDNCSTRPRDVLELISEFQWAEENHDKTFRNILDEYLKGKPWSDFGIDLIIGSVADKKASQEDQMFIPDYLHDHLSKASTPKGPIVAKEDLILDFIKLNDKRNKSSWFNPVTLFVILLIIELAIWIQASKPNVHRLYDLYNKIWLTILGIAGIVILFMWFGTDHIATKQNWNLLWLHPLYLLILLVYNRQGHWLKWICGLSVLLCLFMFFSLPQQFHTAFIFILLIILIKSLYMIFAKPLPVDQA